MEILLQTRNLMVFFENALALNDLTVEVRTKEIVGVLGSNSAGKTTLMNTISGLILDMKKKEARKGGERISVLGELTFEGEDIVDMKPSQRVKRGIVLSRERHPVFKESDVLENLKIAGYLRTGKEVRGGIEFAFGIPGTLGGAVVMNAGTHLGSISEIVERVIVLNPTDGLQTTLSKDDCCFGYRDSVFQKNRLAILEVELKLRKGVIKAIEESLLKLLEKRERTQPTEKFSAGSIFKNPHGMSAGKLIDSVGLKGFIKGGAKISDVHANFIVNTNNATASDVFFLMKLAQQKVKEFHSVSLEPEIISIGNLE